MFTVIHLGVEVDDPEEQILSRLRGIELFDGLDDYEDLIRTYVHRAEEPYEHLREVIW